MGHASHPVETEAPESNFPLMRTVVMIPMLALLIFFGAEVARNLHYPVLSTVIFLPIFGAVAIILMKRGHDTLVRWTALLVSITTFLLSLPLYTNFNKSTAAMQFVERSAWIRTWSIEYFIGVDGISVLFVLLSALLTILCVTVSWTSITERTKEFYAALLLLEGLMIGVFCSLDLFLFYMFWEAMLIPMYLLIGIWGGPRKIYAAIKFFLFTLVGSVLMLVAIIALVYYARVHSPVGLTFNIQALSHLILPYNLQIWAFLAFFLAFAIKVPMWPLHTWLPDAHVEAPTAGSVILAGVLLKMGTYGFLRFNLALFPQASVQAAPTIAVLAIIGIIYGAAVSYAQTDVKKLVAYSSVSHLGFVMLGLFALNSLGVQGAILQMINHGLSTGALFLLVGMVYEQTHTREIKVYGGLWKVMPVFGTMTLIVSLSSMGLPGLNGFVGEFTILLGAFGSTVLHSPWYAGIAALGVIMAAIYILYMFQRMFLGPEGPIVEESKEHGHPLRDLNWRE